MKYPTQSDYEDNAQGIIRDLCNGYDEYIEELEDKYKEEIETLTARIEEHEEEIETLTARIEELENK